MGKEMEKSAEIEAEKKQKEASSSYEKSSNEKPHEKTVHEKNEAATSTPKPEEEKKEKTKFSCTRIQLFSLIVLSIANFCAGSCVSIQAPFFPTEAEKKGATATQYGFIFGIYPLTLFMTSLALGRTSQYMSPKFLVTVGLLVVGITCILFGTLDLVPDTTTFITLAFVIRIVEGMGSAALKTSCYIIIASQFRGNIGTACGIVETAYGLSYTTGPTLGGALYDLGGYALPFWSMGAIAVLDVIAICFFLPSTERPKIPEKGSMLQLWLNPRIMLCSFSIFTTYNCIGFNHATLGVHLKDFDLSGFMLGMMFAIVGTTAAIGTPVWGYLCDNKFCGLTLNLIGSIGIIFSIFLIGPAPFFDFDPCIWIVVAALVLLGISVGGKLICSFTCAMEETVNRGFPQNMATLGAVSSVRVASQSLGAFVGPSAGGYLMDTLGYREASMCLLLLECVLIFSFIIAICNKGTRIKKAVLISSIERPSVSEKYIDKDVESGKLRKKSICTKHSSK